MLQVLQVLNVAKKINHKVATVFSSAIDKAALFDATITE